MQFADTKEGVLEGALPLLHFYSLTTKVKTFPKNEAPKIKIKFFKKTHSATGAEC